MIGSTPELDNDFIFTHKSMRYAIGYSADDIAYALSEEQIDGKWTWKETLPCYEGFIESNGGAESYMEKFLDQVNSYLSSKGAINEELKTELAKLLHITRLLKYADGKVTQP